MEGDNRRQWETTGDKTTSEPKKPTTPTNTKAARSKVALRTPTVNCLGKNGKKPTKRLRPVSVFPTRIAVRKNAGVFRWCPVGPAVGFGFVGDAKHLAAPTISWMKSVGEVADFEENPDFGGRIF